MTPMFKLFRPNIYVIKSSRHQSESNIGYNYVSKIHPIHTCMYCVKCPGIYVAYVNVLLIANKF